MSEERDETVSQLQGEVGELTEKLDALSLENQRLREELDDSTDRYAGVCVSCRSLAVILGVCRGCGFKQREASELIERLRSSSLTPEEARAIDYYLGHSHPSDSFSLQKGYEEAFSIGRAKLRSLETLE